VYYIATLKLNQSRSLRLVTPINRRFQNWTSVHLFRKTTNLSTCLQVAWMHFEQSAILTVNSHVITRNPRITVSHDKHRTWFLHINNVQQEDRGRYMCQINTITAKTQIGYLNVVGKYIIYIIIQHRNGLPVFDCTSESEVF